MSNITQENLALPIDIEGGEWEHFFSRMTMVLCLFFFIITFIAAYAPIYEVAVTEGKIVPVGSVVRVEHFEGGIVKAINFRAGERVEKGDVIASLTPAAAVSDQDQMGARYVNLSITKMRLQALINDREVDFGDYVTSHPKLVADHLSLYNDEKKTIKHSIGSLTARVRQKAAVTKATELEVKSLKNQLEIHKEQFQMRATLVKDGYTTRNSYLEAKAKVAETEARLAQMQGQLISTVNGLTEAEQQLSEAMAQARQKWATELTQTSASLSEIDAAIGKVEDRVNRLNVRAPIAGILQSLQPKAVGEVINPGDLVAELVPEDGKLIAEVRLKPSDATNIHKDQAARVTVTAFDTKEFGTLDGLVERVSATTFTNDKGEEYYEVRLNLDRLTVRRKGIDYPVLPGMTVRAELIKGERSLLRYLLKPIFTAFENSFGEH
ncbi:MAG: HlyD family type I secretion membrane fusion protein [Rhodomicrobium sp.]|nr:MAG: HlyD family type I secretion membrane fusion protein [Rhodomicrobium sp.]